jgi:tetratricopeptide (TPR) repeat protein
MSFARDQIERGDGDAALLAADDDVAARPTAPDAHYDRASALELLENYPASIEAYEHAIALNTEAKQVDGFMLDDAYFSALVAASRAETGDSAKAAAWFARYPSHSPAGAHLRDAEEWSRRALGVLKSTLDKTQTLG